MDATIPTDVAGFVSWRRVIYVATGIGTVVAILTSMVIIFQVGVLSGFSCRPPTKTDPSAGIGFDLGSSYIAVSIRHEHGYSASFLFDNVSSEYKQLYRQASEGPERCYGDDWRGSKSQCVLSDVNPQDNPGQRPAINIIADALGRVKYAIEETNSWIRIDKALVSSPNLPGLCREDIEAAMRQVGIEVVRTSRIPRQPHGLTAACAAYGRGLCSDYTRCRSCRYQERWEMPLQVVLVATYTDEALLVEYAGVRYALDVIFESNTIVDWEAGAAALSSMVDPQRHWDRVRARLLELPEIWRLVYSQVDVVILAGTHASNETFLEVVKDTFARFQYSPPEILTGYGAITGARGAAELAFRSCFQY